MGNIRREKRKKKFGYKHQFKHEEPEIDLMVELSHSEADDLMGCVSVVRELRSMLERAYDLGKGTAKSIYS